MSSPAFVTPLEFSNNLAAPDSLRVANDPHLTTAWFSLLAQTALPEGAEVTSLGCRSSENLFLMRTPAQPGKLLSLATYYSPLFGLCGDSPVDEDVLKEQLSSLRGRRFGFHEARIQPMTPGAQDWEVVSKNLQAAGWIVDRFFCFGNWYLPVGALSYQEYLAQRPGALRSTIRRAYAKLKRHPGFQIDIITGGQDLSAAVSDYSTVYQKSWKVPEPYPAFIPGLCQLAAEQGWLRLGIARLDGRPIAAQLWLVASGKAMIVKLAYDGEYAHTSVGTVLTAHLMRHVIDVDKVSEVDYLMGDDTYKRDWMSHRRERYGLIAFNPRFVAGIAGLVRHRLGILKKELFR